MPDDLELRIAGKIFTGWEDVKISRTIEAASGSFQLTVNDSEPWPIVEGAEVTIESGGFRLVNGFVDDVEPAFDPNARSMTVKGRDKPADLVDCSALNEPGEWNDLPLLDICQAIAEPFGVIVVREGEDSFPDKFSKFKLEPGEKAFEAIERACRLRAALAYSDGRGILVIGRPSKLKLPVLLEEGKNLKSGRSKLSSRARYSEVICRGQAQGTEEENGETASEAEGKAFDRGVSRYRPLLVIPDGSVNDRQAQARAEWETAVRLARGSSVTVVVQGWRILESENDPEPTYRTSAGAPVFRNTVGAEFWQQNRLVPVKSPSLKVDAELLIVGLEMTRSRDGGTETKLRLVPPKAYAPVREILEEDDPLRILRNETIPSTPGFFDGLEQP